MIISIAWRNIWRNRLRSLVIIIAITLGIFAGVLSTGFMKGMVDQRIESAIENEVSHIQIHHPEYRQEDKLIQYIPQASEKVRELNEISTVRASSQRLSANCMITSAGKGSGINLTGIKPNQEKQVTNIHEQLIKGSYFNDVPKRVIPLVIGQKLADKLNAKIKSRIVIQFADVNGNPVSMGCRVTGIYKTDNSAFDGMHAYVRYSDLQEIMGVPEKAGHEIAVLLHDNDALEKAKSEIAGMYHNKEVNTWKELSPELSYLNDMMEQYMYIIVIIILLALLFGIVNTMLMAVLERIKELGMLMAIGMNRKRVFSMIMLEAIFLALTGGLTGIVIGYGITELLGQTGVDLSIYATGLEAMGWSTVIYPDIGLDTLAGVTGLVILTGIVSAIYPALKALRLNPAESIRTE